jgi:hypothetical protein
MAKFREALNEAISADPEATAKALAAVLGVAAGTMRTVGDRPRKVEIPVPEAPKAPPAPEAPKPGVVFASRHLGFRLVVRPGQKKFYGDGNVEFIAPKLLEFDNGKARVEDPDDIARVRKFIEKQRRIGVEPQIVELRDEIAEAAAAGRSIVPIASSKVTGDTPLSELVTV